MNNHRYCKHRIYGVGSAIRIKTRRKPEGNLWMVEFHAVADKGKFFFVEHEFTTAEDIEFISDDEATVLYKEARTAPKKKKRKVVKNDKENLTEFLDKLFRA